ncbi:MAG: hypothetical protein ACLFS7_06485 [Desulfosudaceae bacterium]
MGFLYPDNVRRLLAPVVVLASGLILAQLIGSVLVYQSNLALLHKLTLLREAGVFPLPGMGVAPPLSSLSAALAGGLYFTLSVGAGVVLLTMAADLLVAATPRRVRKYLLIVLICLWLVLLGWANLKGWCPGLSAYLLILPGPVLWLNRRGWRRLAAAERLPWRRLFHLLLILLLCAWWITRIDSAVFVNIKDNLLLTSKAGNKVVHLYYRYTLYPAGAFKSLAQKQVKTCRLEGFADDERRKRVAETLAEHDFFVVDARPTDLVVSAPGGRQGDQLQLSCRDKAGLTVPTDVFLATAGDYLERLSNRCDVNAAFRNFTIFSLLGVAPLVLYLATFVVLAFIPGLFISLRLSSWLVPLLCCLFWAGVVFYVDTPPLRTPDAGAAARAMESGSRRERIAALRYIFNHRLEITGFQGYRHLLESGDFAQRYWLVRNLGHSRHPRSWQWISRFLNSDSSYLVCKAMEATAVRSSRPGRDVPGEIEASLLEKLALSDNWYVQSYAYKTLRSLGWLPVKSG